MGSVSPVLPDESKLMGDAVPPLRVFPLYVWARTNVLLAPNWKYCKDMGGALALFQFNVA